MSDFARTHAALFDELERQGVLSVDIGRLAQAVMDAERIIDQSRAPYQRCETCE